MLPNMTEYGPHTIILYFKNRAYIPQTFLKVHGSPHEFIKKKTLAAIG